MSNETAEQQTTAPETGAQIDPLVETTLPMTQQEAVDSLRDWGERLWEIVVTPSWRQYQLVILLGLLLLAYLLKTLTKRPFQNWLRDRENWPKWRLRLLVQIRNRLTLVYFVILSWSTYWIMQQATWPSRSHVIGVFATMALAWLVISFVARLVRNKTLRKIVKWSLWAYAAVVALGLIDEVIVFLDSIAIGIGSFRLSMLALIKAFLLILAMMIGARLSTKAITTGLQRNEDISPSVRVLAIKAFQVVIYGAVVLIGVQALGFDLTGLALLTGAIGVGIGFGLQKVVSNLISGVIILLDRSIKPGDVISIGDTFGWIDSLGARYASVVTRDGREYLIPNEDLITNQVVNWSFSDEFVRLDMNFGTSYHSDPHLVRKVACEAAKSVTRVLSGNRAPICHIVGFGDSSVDYTLRIWISDPTAGLTNVQGDVFLALWDAFKENDINIPFPQREMRVLNEQLPVRVQQGDG